MENRNMLTVLAEDVSFEDSVLNGTFRVKPSKELFYLAGANAYVVDTLKIGSQDTYLEIELDGTAAKGNTAVKLLIGGNEMIGISAEVKESKYKKFTVPETIVLAKSEYELMQWASDIKFDKLMANMTQAGVPDEYVQIVNQLAMMLQMSSMLP
jgi:hypothetical protein